MKNIIERWKKLETWQKILYVFLSLWLFDLFLSLSSIWRVLIIVLFIFAIVITPSSENYDQVILNNDKREVEKDYLFTFLEENKQLTGACSRSEWVYVIPNNTIKEDLEPILYEIYSNRKDKTDRTNISIYTEDAIQNIKAEISDISIAFLNDGFNCDSPREVEIKDNFELYQSTRNL